MPDTWEYPWYAAWDLAFHCVALAHVDPEFAKSQLDPALPRVVHAPERPAARVRVVVRATSTRRCTRGPRCASTRSPATSDFEFLERVFHKLLLNFTWWVNRKDADGNNLFEGGFLGLDNIGPFDRSSLPVSGRLEQSDGTAWMAMYCQNLLELALAARRARPDLRGPRDEVLRALRADRARR